MTGKLKRPSCDLNLALLTVLSAFLTSTGVGAVQKLSHSQLQQQRFIGNVQYRLITGCALKGLVPGSIISWSFSSITEYGKSGIARTHGDFSINDRRYVILLDRVCTLNRAKDRKYAPAEQCVGFYRGTDGQYAVSNEDGQYFSRLAFLRLEKNSAPCAVH